jgi:hypothetical protein
VFVFDSSHKKLIYFNSFLRDILTFPFFNTIENNIYSSYKTMKQAILLLASLAFARATITTTDEHSLRGGGVASPRRSLQDMPGLRPGESNCYLHPDNDGTVECTVRSKYSAYDTTYGYNPTTSLGCVTDSVKGFQFCANIGLKLQADPNGSLPPPPGISGPAAGSTMPGIGVDFPITEPSTGVVSTITDCPRFKPDPGSHCAGWIPVGGTKVSCQFGIEQCNCARQDGDANKIGWNCPKVGSGNVITPGASFPITVPAPPPAPASAQVPMIPDTVVVGKVEAEIVSF